MKTAKEKMRYKYGDYILHPIKGRYYVYKLETVNGEIKETYVGPLVDVVETYLKLKNRSGGVGDAPLSRGRDLNPGPLPYQGNALARLSYRGTLSYNG